jgi:hypothetical protein
LSFLEYVDGRLAIARALARGQCGGSYIDSILLLSSLLSGFASDIWPGEGIDRKRFVQLWVNYADPSIDVTRVSLPLLITHLQQKGRLAEANTLQATRPDAFGLFSKGSILRGRLIDLTENDIAKACPSLTMREIREWAYPNVFYGKVRSPIVHEYELGHHAFHRPHTWAEGEGVSYVNMVGSPRLIHFNLEWIVVIARSIAQRGEPAILGTSNPPSGSWWTDG